MWKCSPQTHTLERGQLCLGLQGARAPSLFPRANLRHALLMDCESWGIRTHRRGWAQGTQVVRGKERAAHRGHSLSPAWRPVGCLGGWLINPGSAPHSLSPGLSFHSK